MQSQQYHLIDDDGRHWYVGTRADCDDMQDVFGCGHVEPCNWPNTCCGDQDDVGVTLDGG